MKKAIYFIGSIILVIVLTNGSAFQPDNTLTQAEEELPQTDEASAADLTPTEDILTQKQELAMPDVKITRPFPKRGIPVLMYHSVRTNGKNSLCVSKEQFKNEMEWLHKHMYHTMNIDEFYEALINYGPVPENPVLITFDDGYQDNYTTAWPILKQYGFTATFFVITQYVNPSKIDWGQLKKLIGQGNSIGSHTVNHYSLSMLSPAQQKKEISNSKRILEEKLSIPIRAFCFPIGKYNKTTLKLLSESGYSIAFTTKNGRVHAGDNPFLLKRIRIWGGMTTSQFINQVANIH